MEEKKNEVKLSSKKEIKINRNTKEEKLKQAPDEVLAMAIRDMMNRDKK